MEIDKLRSEINYLLEKINEHSDRFTNKPHVPSLEIDVMIAKINKLQNHMAVLKYLIELREENIKAKNKETVMNVVEQEPEALKDEHLQQEIKKDLHKVDEENLQALKSKDKKSVSDVISEQPISKISDALTLNDRYLYANELFNKQMNVFNDFIKQIDASDSKSEILSITEHFKNEFNWDEENKFVKDFIQLIERKFIP
ncbi:MAG: hypothetical protein Kow0079_08930 [Vicingaceae bacterium]